MFKNKKKFLIVVIICSFLFKDAVLSHLVGNVLSHFVGLNIRFQKISFLNGKIALDNVIIMDYNYNILAKVEKSFIDIDYKNFSIDNILVENAEVLLDIDYTYNDKLNWEIPFYDDSFYEPAIYFNTILKSIDIKNSKVIFIDRSYEKVFEKVLPNFSAQILFKDEDIILSGESYIDKERYSVNTNISYLGDVRVNIDMQNIALNNDILVYTRVEDYVEVFSGIGNISLCIYDKDIKGSIKVENVDTKNDFLNNNIFIKDALVEIDSTYVEAKINYELSGYDSKHCYGELFIDILNSECSFDSNLDSIDLNYIFKDIKVLSEYPLDSLGVISLKLSIFIDIFKMDKKFKIEINEKDRAKIFGLEYSSCSVNFTLDLLNRFKDANLYISFIDDSLAIDLEMDRGYDIEIQGRYNTKFLELFKIYVPNIQMLGDVSVKSDYSFSNVTVQSTNNLLNDYFGGDVVKAGMKIDNKSILLNITSNDLDVKYNNFGNLFYLDIFAKNDFYLKMDKITLKSKGKIELDSVLDDDQWKLSKLDVDLQIDNFNIFGIELKKEISLLSDYRERKVRFNPFNLYVEYELMKFDFDNLFLELFSPENISKIYANINSYSLKSYLNESISNNFKDFIAVFNFDILNSNIFVKKLATDHFHIYGYYKDLDNLYFNLEVLDLELYKDRLFIPYLNIEVDQNSSKILDGKLNILDRDVKIFGGTEHSLIENIYKIKYTSDDFVIEGSVIKDLLDLKLYFSVDKINSIYGTDIFLSGEIYAFGNVKDILMKGSISLNDSIDRAVVLDISYNSLCFNLDRVNIKRAKNYLSQDISGIISILDNSIKVNYYKENLDISNILGFECSLDLDLNIQGPLNNFMYNISSKVIFSDQNRISILAKGNLDKIDFEKVIIKDLDDSIEIKGGYSFKKNFVDIDISTERFELSNISEKLLNTRVSGVISGGLKIINSTSFGDMKFEKISFIIDSEKQFGLWPIELAFDNISGNIRSFGDNLTLEFIGILNRGDISSNIKYNLSNYSIGGNISIKHSVIGIKKYFSLLINSEIDIDSNIIDAKIRINGGNIFDINIPNTLSYDSESDYFPKLKINEIKISIEKNVEINLQSMYSFETIQSFVLGDIRLKNDGQEFKVSGNIFGNSGEISFSKYIFRIESLNLSFRDNMSYPDISLYAKSFILDEDIYISLDGNLSNKKIQLVDKNSYLNERERDFLAISLWSNGNMNINEILYLISYNLDKKDAAGLISAQITSSVLIDPFAQKIKDLFSLYHFKVYTPIFDIYKVSYDSIYRPLSSMEFDLSTNIYKNIVFMGCFLKMSDSGLYIKNIDLSFFSLNHFKISFSFNHSFDRMVFSGLIVSKKINWQKQDLEIGFCIDDIFEKPSNLFKFNITMNLRF